MFMVVRISACRNRLLHALGVDLKVQQVLFQLLCRIANGEIVSLRIRRSFLARQGNRGNSLSRGSRIPSLLSLLTEPLLRCVHAVSLPLVTLLSPMSMPSLSSSP